MMRLAGLGRIDREVDRAGELLVRAGVAERLAAQQVGARVDVDPHDLGRRRGRDRQRRNQQTNRGASQFRLGHGDALRRRSPWIPFVVAHILPGVVGDGGGCPTCARPGHDRDAGFVSEELLDGAESIRHSQRFESFRPHAGVDHAQPRGYALHVAPLPNRVGSGARRRGQQLTAPHGQALRVAGEVVPCMTSRELRMPPGFIGRPGSRTRSLLWQGHVQGHQQAAGNGAQSARCRARHSTG